MSTTEGMQAALKSATAAGGGGAAGNAGSSLNAATELFVQLPFKVHDRAFTTAGDRLVHLAVDELEIARRKANQLARDFEHCKLLTSSYEDKVARPEQAFKQSQTVVEEISGMLVERDARIQALTSERDFATNRVTALCDSQPDKARIRQLLNRVSEMAPERQFKVILRTPRKRKPLMILGASSANGVTTITVSDTLR